MELAYGRLKMNKMGSDVPIELATPAEIRILQEAFNPLAGGEAVSDLVVVKNVKRSSQKEYGRLKAKYMNLRPGKEKGTASLLEKLYPGDETTVKLPETFKEIGVSTRKPNPGEGFGPVTYAPLHGDVVDEEEEIEEAPPTPSPKESVKATTK